MNPSTHTGNNGGGWHPRVVRMVAHFPRNGFCGVCSTRVIGMEITDIDLGVPICPSCIEALIDAESALLHTAGLVHPPEALVKANP